MTALVTALYAEGRSDERFLPRIIQRAAVDLLSRRGRRVVDVLEPTLLTPDEKQSRAEDILAVARKASGYHALFIHADADAPTPDRAYTERIEPGVMRVRSARTSGAAVCADLIPVIPIQATEAWLLADADALRAVIGTNARSADLGIPLVPHEIEGLANPKQRLSEIVRRAMAVRPRRRRNLDIGELYEPLADRIHLAQLERLPAYQQFSDDLARTLASLGFFA